MNSIAFGAKNQTPCISLMVLCLLCSTGVLKGQENQIIHRVYSHLLEPKEHPDYERRQVKPPGWDTFGNRPQFTTLRGFSVENDTITGYAQELEKYTRTHELGDVIWPSYPILFAKNLGDFADEIKRRGLFLFDIWGYVPGSGPGGYWQQFKPSLAALALLASKLGERWLGTDIGEQDGRYIGGYASQMTPASANRFEQYLNFQRHFERMGDDLGHKHATLVSLNYGHYFLKEGTYTMIGAETAQALPNNQVYYAFIRGAGKQYGVPWFGNASIFNRWGFKTYGSSGKSDGYEHGPTKGSSLSLMKRLLYSHILYNCVAVGFENGWFDGDKLSPIGRIQQSAQRLIKQYGTLGVLHSPIALMVDFYSGWSFPRHLYSADIYRVWGNLPYDEGDYLIDAVLDMLYPGYQNSSFYHDESGFIAPTPFGDIADCLLSDAPAWLLNRYPVIVLAGKITHGSRELGDKLTAYIQQGGHLVMTAGNLTNVSLGGFSGLLTDHQSVVERCHGKGKLTLFHRDWGIESQSNRSPIPHSEMDQPLYKPYRLVSEFRQLLANVFSNQMLFDINNTNLSFITCRKTNGVYTIGIQNNVWKQHPYRIVSRCGAIESIHEITLDTSERSAIGYTPEGVRVDTLGTNGEGCIAGGDIRIFEIKVREDGVEEIAHQAPPSRPRNCLLPLRNIRTIKEEILSRPTFFAHFDGIVVDWSYLCEREKKALTQEAGWIRRQGLRVWVDVSSGINLYPTLRLVDNVQADYQTTMEIVADLQFKMGILGAQDLIVSLHRYPENNFTGEQTKEAFENTLKKIAAQAAKKNQRVHMRLTFGKPPWNIAEAERMLKNVGATNLFMAVPTALLGNTAISQESFAKWKGKLGAWLAASHRKDLAGRLWDAHAPAHLEPQQEKLRPWFLQSSETPIVLDAVYDDKDQANQEYMDAVYMQKMVKP